MAKGKIHLVSGIARVYQYANQNISTKMEC